MSDTATDTVLVMRVATRESVEASVLRHGLIFGAWEEAPQWEFRFRIGRATVYSGHGRWHVKFAQNGPSRMNSSLAEVLDHVRSLALESAAVLIEYGRVAKAGKK